MSNKNKSFAEILNEIFEKGSEEYELIYSFFINLKDKNFKSEDDLINKLRKKLLSMLELVAYYERVGYYEQCLSRTYDKWHAILYVTRDIKKFIDKLVSSHSKYIAGLSEMSFEKILESCIEDDERVENGECNLDGYLDDLENYDMEKEKNEVEKVDRLRKEYAFEEEIQRRRDSWIF